jgi:hypothetical protein
VWVEPESVISTTRSASSGTGTASDDTRIDAVPGNVVGHTGEPDPPLPDGGIVPPAPETVAASWIVSVDSLGTIFSVRGRLTERTSGMPVSPAEGSNALGTAPLSPWEGVYVATGPPGQRAVGP